MKKLILALLAAAIAAMPAAGQRQRVAPLRPASLQALADQVSHDGLRANVQRLVSFGTRHTLSDRNHPTRGIGAALSWTEAEFRRYSAACGRCLQVIRTGDTVTGRRIPAPTLVENVVAIQRGTLRPEQVVIITGH